MEYKIGFYYNLTHLSSHNNRLIVVFNDGHLQFRLINPDILKKYHLRFTNLTSYYSFELPILYKEDYDGEIEDIIFFMDLPNLSSLNSNISGFSIGEPEMQVRGTILYFNGKDFFHDEINRNSPELIFSKAVIHYYAVRKKVLFLRNEARPEILIDPYLDFVKKAKSYIDTIRINDILSDLQVSVKDYLRTKIGDDDTYYIYRNAEVSSPIVKKDEYLQRVIGIGSICIYKDSGYTNKLEMYAEEFINEHPIGEYTGELLEKEKQRIIANYSKEEHMGFLLAKRFIEKENNRAYELPRWESILDEAYKDLFLKFQLKNISNDDRNFEKRMYVLTNRFSDAKKEVDAINEYIKDITTYIP